MIDSKKVIKGLECCIKHDPDDKMRCGECPYKGACLNRLKADALALLKAQEPRVMTLEEASNSTVPMWFEKSGDECGWITGIDCSPIQATTIGQVEGDDWYNLLITDYGRLWRCWSVKPTDAQREREPWN